MKFQITMNEVIEAVWQTVNGTCRSNDIMQSLDDGIYEILAKAYSEATGTSLSYDSSKVEELAYHLARIFQARDFEESFWETMAGSGQDHCKACGWWDEDVYYSPDDYVDAPINEGCMCSECAEGLEERF